MAVIDPVYAKMKLSPPHTWHAAEAFLYFLGLLGNGARPFDVLRAVSYSALSSRPKGMVERLLSMDCMGEELPSCAPT